MRKMERNKKRLMAAFMLLTFIVSNRNSMVSAFSGSVNTVSEVSETKETEQAGEDESLIESSDAGISSENSEIGILPDLDAVDDSENGSDGSQQDANFRWSKPDEVNLWYEGVLAHAGTSGGNINGYLVNVNGKTMRAFCITSDKDGYYGNAPVNFGNISDLPENYRNGIAYILEKSYDKASAETITVAIHMLENRLGMTSKWNPDEAYGNTFDVAYARMISQEAMDNAGTYVFDKKPQINIVSLETAWSKENTVKSVIETQDCDHWSLVLPPGVSADVMSGNAGTTITFTKTDHDAFMAGSKTVQFTAIANYDSTEAMMFARREGYQDYVIFDFSDSGDQTVMNLTLPQEMPKGSLEITKRYYHLNGNDSSPEEGAVYQIWNDAENPETAALLWQETTDTNGRIRLENLEPGLYYYRQIGPGITQDTKQAGMISVDSQRYQITVPSGGEANAQRFNDMKPSIRIYKQLLLMDEVKKIPEEGAVFEAWPDSAPSDIRTVTTDANGIAELPFVQSGIWHIKQKASRDPAISVFPDTKTIDVENGTNVVVEFENYEKWGRLEVEKKEDWTEGYITPGNGIRFQIWRNDYPDYTSAPETSRAEIILDKDGYGISEPVYIGIYHVEQVSTPQSHKKVAEFTIDIKEEKQTVHVELINDPVLGWVELTKFQVKYEPEAFKMLEANAEFAIYPIEYETWENAKNALVSGSEKYLALTEILKTDKDGYAKSGDLPYGKYRVEQIASADRNYADVESWEIEINEDGDQLTYIKDNPYKETYLRVIKMDEDTNEPISLSANFQLYQTADQKGLFSEPLLLSKDGVSEFSTNKEGYTDFNGILLEIGEYYVVETSAPDGYLLSDDRHSFSITEDRDDGFVMIENRCVKQINVKNKWIQKGGLRLIKMDTDSREKLAGAAFDLYLDQKPEPLKIESIVTDDHGEASVDGLDIGQYYLIETTAPDGYGLLDEKISFEIKGTNNAHNVQIQEIEVENKKILGAISVHKIDEMKKIPLSGVEFEIFDEDGDLVDELTTDAEGQAKSEILPKGKYTIVETKALNGYYVDGSVYTIDIEKTPEDAQEYMVYDLEIGNLKYGKVEVYKVTGGGEKTPIPDVVFGIFHRETKEKFGEFATDENGFATVYVMPGSYYLQELKSKEGYALSTEIFEMEAEWNGLYKFEITNDEIVVEIEKTDILDGKVVAGAEITLYDSNGKDIGIYISDENGKIKIAGISAGKYTYKETKAPRGYAINPSIFSLEIEDDGEVKGDTTFTNEPTVLQLNKISSANKAPLSGASFQIFDGSGKLVRFYLREDIYFADENGDLDRISSDENGMLTCKYLPAGTYALKEVVVPLGYLLPDEPWNITIEASNSITSPASFLLENIPDEPVKGSRTPNITKTGESIDAPQFIGFMLLGSSFICFLARFPKTNIFKKFRIKFEKHRKLKP